MADMPADPGLPENILGDIRRIFEDVLNPALSPITSVLGDVRQITVATSDVVRLLPSAGLFGLSDIETVLRDFAGVLGERALTNLSTALDGSSQPFFNVDFDQVSRVGTVDADDMSAGPQFGMGVTAPVRTAVAMTKNSDNGLPAFRDWANGDNGGMAAADHSALAFAFLAPAGQTVAGAPQWQAAVTTFLADALAALRRIAASPLLEAGERQILDDLLSTLANATDAVGRALDAIGRLELKVFEKHNTEIARLLPLSALQTLTAEMTGFADIMAASAGGLAGADLRAVKRKIAMLAPIKQGILGLQMTFPLNASITVGGNAMGLIGGIGGIAAGIQASATGLLGFGGSISAGVLILSLMGLIVQPALLALSIYEMTLNFAQIDAGP